MSTIWLTKTFQVRLNGSLIDDWYLIEISSISDHYFVRDNVVTISTDSQPSSIHFIDDVKLDFNMQKLDEIEKEDVEKMDNHLDELKMDTSPDEKPQELQIITEITDEIRRVNGDTVDIEINNNISKTTIIQDGEIEEIHNQRQTNKFSTEIKLEDMNMNLNMNHESSPDTTPSTPDHNSPFSSPGTPNITTTKTLTLTQNPITSTTANFLRQEQNHTEKNFVPNNTEIKFKTAVYEQPSSPGKDQKSTEKRISHIEQIRQNFEKSAQMSSEIPAPQPGPRRSSIPLSINKTSPSKIPVLNSKSSNLHHKTSPTLRTNGSAHKLNNHNDKNHNDS